MVMSSDQLKLRYIGVKPYIGLVFSRKTANLKSILKNSSLEGHKGERSIKRIYIYTHIYMHIHVYVIFKGAFFKIRINHRLICSVLL